MSYMINGSAQGTAGQTLQRSRDSHQGGEKSKWHLGLAGKTRANFPVTSICSSITQSPAQFDVRLQFCFKQCSVRKDSYSSSNCTLM